MKEKKVFIKIKDLQKKGFSIRKSAKHLGISRDTVKKYQNMTHEEYEIMVETIMKKSSLVKYETVILDWLRDYPDMTSAQVFDWLLEHYDLSIAERTVSRFVKTLRENHGIPKTKRPRDYEAVEELPMGHQMQLDFGVKNMQLPNRKGHKKVYFAGFVLSNSKYKWAYFQSRPFTTNDLLKAMDGCFAFFGGTTNEIVIDQDSIITVSENYGDIIYTHEFEKYKKLHNLSIRVCRKADPESKGLVENMVKFVKGNFLANRTYMEEHYMNEAFLAWLERTGNAKVHGTTKKVPAKVFEVEREHLKSILSTDYNHCETSITRRVRKDNTILYNSNRYSLPLGTYNKEDIVSVEEANGKLQIWNSFRDYIIAEHSVSLEKGKLIKNTDHSRNKENSLDKLQSRILGIVGDAFLPYLLEIRERKPRYYRDQLSLLEELATSYNLSHLEDAILYCVEKELYSIIDVKNACQHLKSEESALPCEPIVIPRIRPLNNPELMSIITQKRKIDVYAQVGGDVHE